MNARWIVAAPIPIARILQGVFPVRVMRASKSKEEQIALVSCLFNQKKSEGKVNGAI